MEEDTSGFTADFFIGNRQRLRKLFTGTAPIILTANGLLQRNADSAFPFRQDSSFWYLTGLDEGDLVLVIDKNREYLIAPEQSEYQHAFDGTLDYTAITKRSGIEQVIGGKEGWRLLSTRLKKVKHVSTLAASPALVEPYGIYTNPARHQLIKKMQAINPDLELLDLRPHLVRMRAVKQPLELEAMRASIDLTISAIKQALKRLPRATYEYELEAEIVHHFLRAGAEPAWKPLIAAGANATVLHYMANNSKLVSGELLYIDVGAEVSHYAADITRTYSIGGKPSRRQQEVIKAVKDVQDYALSLVKPGIVLKKYEKQVEQFMGEKLRELGLIKTTDHKTVRHYYPHGTSHFLGLDVHDVGDYDKPLEPSMVITVEPGIYIPEEGIGVRIEDDVLITPDGHENLSAALPR